MRKHRDYEELDSSINLIVNTKSPTKWLLIDRETGQIFQGNDLGYWDRLDPVIKDELDV
jgi:hypothetical protein